MLGAVTQAVRGLMESTLTNNVHFVHIFTKGDRDSELPYIKEAKQQLGLDVMVRPVVATPGFDRILAIGERPDFICDHALVKDVTNIESLKAALKWCITGEPDDRVTTIEKWLSRLMGGKVVKVNNA